MDTWPATARQNGHSAKDIRLNGHNAKPRLGRTDVIQNVHLAETLAIEQTIVKFVDYCNIIYTYNSQYVYMHIL